MIDQGLIVELISAVIALITVIKAIYESWKTKQVVTFYTEPVNEVSQRVIEKLPVRSYAMSDETRRFIKMGESESDKALIDAQINNAEINGLLSYYIDTSQGWYLIEYGLIKASAKGAAPKISG